MLETIALAALLLATVPFCMVLANLFFYRTAPDPPAGDGPGLPAVSVLVPARDEEESIGACVESALATRGVDLEVVVMDDHSSDRTAEIVRAIAARDPRVRLVDAPELPEGWNGKQHACHRLAGEARHPVLAFIDADVRLERDGLRRMLGFLERSGADLVSGIPWQRTVTWMEKLVVPLIHFVMLGYLPMAGVRWSKHPAFAAGCGQLFVVRAEAYRRAGGHAAIRSSRHDGLKLPRLFRAAGQSTDLCDATRVASCRMYRSAREVWNGFAKNADEGMATPNAILPWTVLLAGGQITPVVLLGWALVGGASATATLWAALGTVAVYGTRLVLTARFRQSFVGWVLHPAGVAATLAIQWYALWKWARGRELPWKGRVAHGA